MGYIGTKPSAVPLTSADITDGIITSAKIANDAIVTGKIADGAIIGADINSTFDLTGKTVTGAGASQEVGTWTPTWSLDGGTITSIDTTAYSYVKIGRIVVAQLQAHLNTTSGSGGVNFTLPFTTSGNGSFAGSEYGQAGADYLGQYADNTTGATIYRLEGFIQNPYFRITVTYRSAS